MCELVQGEIVDTKQQTLVNTIEKYQLPTGVGTGQWAVAIGQVIQAGKIWREDNRMSTGRVKG